MLFSVVINVCACRIYIEVKDLLLNVENNVRLTTIIV